MNIIIANKYKNLINSSNIEVMKELTGVFKISEIVNSFNSMFYKKLIIDATAIEGFPKEDVIRSLVNLFDTEKLILFLPPDNPAPMTFLNFLVSVNLYNFTDNINGLRELINKSNTFEDVKMFSNNSVSNDTFNNEKSEFSQEHLKISNGKIILGIKNVNLDAGSTSLVYILMKALEEVHKKRAIAVEIDKKDFIYYHNKNMYSITKDKMDSFFSNVGNNEIVLVDLGEQGEIDFCSDIIYLINPSLYSINSLMMKNRNSFNLLKNKKVILGNSLLNSDDANVFAREAGISIYFNLPPLSDRVHNKIVDDLLLKLGLIEVFEDKPKRGLFDIFK